ncbi:hypothetical protein ACJRO7_022418 [Eucalyptus globulus]|uniref:Cathepsin propeptide inhibitor domain-containing protein n=2 Tax=Eucalyptus TaxID=3932 RepID=A0ABD3K838_EUCGL
MGLGQRTDAEVMALFESWIVKHGKVYNVPGEKEMRFEIFKDTLRRIDQHNSENHSHTLGLTHFSDQTVEERCSMFGRPPSKSPLDESQSHCRDEPRLRDELPESSNGKKEGAVVGVKDQGSSANSIILTTDEFLEKKSEFRTPWFDSEQNFRERAILS